MPASTTLHEPADKLTVETIDMHRAIVSLIEELEAVDWYTQRADACKDAQLCTGGIVKAAIEGCVVVARDVGSIVVGQDLQVSFLSSDAAHEHFSISESLVLKIEAPDAICAIPAGGATSIKTT